MGRPGLAQNRKFLRLARTLKSAALARGCLELLWDVCYQNGDDYLGSADDVELLAQWPGDPGVLVEALADAGGEGSKGFIEIHETLHGWRVHDLFENAPNYVQKRLEREIVRRQRGETISTLRSEAGKKGREAQLARANPRQTADGCPQQQTSVKQAAANVGTPSPSPSPSPITSSLRSEDEPPLPLGKVEGLEDQVLSLWREIAVPAGLPSVLKLDKKRRMSLRARLQDPSWFSLFREALVYAATHPEGAWMRGEGSRPWRASLDYFLRPDSVLKTVEKSRTVGITRASPPPNVPARRCATVEAEHRNQLAQMAPFPTLPRANGATS